jgi:hypothetical protein
MGNAKLEIYEPDATINLVLNPRLTVNTTGYTASGSSISRTLARARWGLASLLVNTNGAGLLEGVYFSVNPAVSNQPYAGSLYARGSGTVRARLRDATNGIEFVSERVTLDDRHWVRLEVLGRTGGAVSADLRLYAETVGSIQDVDFYADGFQIEAKHYVSSYCDGDLEDDLPRHAGDRYFRWTGTKHESTSTRSDRLRPAGRPRQIELADIEVYVTQASGLGMAPVLLNIQRLGAQDGSEVQSFRAQDRVLQMVFWARKDPQSAVCSPASLRELHLLRERLENLIKPDRSHGAQPFLLRYLDGPDSLEVFAHYESGLEFDGDLRFPYHNSFGVRMLAVRPYWISDSQDVLQLTANQSIPNSNCLIARIDGEWQALGTGANSEVRDFAVHPNGDIYMVGAFTAVDGVASTRGIARWNGSSWESAGGGLDDGVAYQVAIGPDGTVFLAGDFDNIAAVARNNVARYNPATDTWSSMGSGPGLDDLALAVAVDKDRNVYFGGGFANTFGGGTALNLITRWNPDTNTFLAMGTGPGLNLSAGGGRVRGITIDLDGEVPFITGLFDRATGGVAGDLRGVATYNFTANSFDEPGDDGATSNDVRRSDLSPDGKFYVGGFFTHIGVSDADSVAVYTRQDWLPLGRQGDGIIGGVSGVVRNIKVSHKNRLVFGGDFDQVTGAEFATFAASWNGTSFSHLDLELPGPTNEVHGILLLDDDIYLGHEISGVASLASAIQTVTNRGRASAGAVLEVLGPARLLWLENQTTGHVIRMDLIVQTGERVTIDLRPGMHKAVSDFRGNVSSGILRDSDVGGFKLIPGDNQIAFFAVDTTGTTEISLRWGIRHWSFDDIAWAQNTG